MTDMLKGVEMPKTSPEAVAREVLAGLEAETEDIFPDPTRGSPQETVVGSADNQPDLVAIMRFPTADAVRAFLGNAACRAQIVHRSQ